MAELDEWVPVMRPTDTQDGTETRTEEAVDEWVPARLPFSDAPTNKKGAPPAWRVMVSLAESPEDQVTTLRNLQKQAGVPEDAEWVTFGGRKGGERLVGGIPRQEDPIEGKTMLIYTDPDTGQRQAFDPKGFSHEDILGDLADAGVSFARVVSAGLGALLGGAAGSATGVGTVPGAYGGMIAGSQAVKYAAEPIAEAMMDVDVPDTRGTGEKLLEGGMDVGMEAAFPVAGGLMAKTGTQVARAPFRQAMWKPKGMGKKEVLRDIEEMAVEQGVDPNRAIRGAAPLVTESTTVRGFFEGLKKYPKAAETVQARVNETLQVVRNAFAQTHIKLGGAVEKSTAGDAVQHGLQKFAARKEIAQENLEAQVEGIIGKDTPIPATRTMELIQQRMAKVQGMESSAKIPKEFQEVMEDIQKSNGAPRFEAFRESRRQKASGVSFGETTPGHAKADELKALYGAMSEDMAAAAASKGKAAAGLWKDAMKNWSERQDVLTQLRDVVNAPETHTAFTRAMSGSKDGAGKLARLKGTLNSDDWDTVVSVKLWDMATAHTTAGARGETARVFSPSLFIRNWRQMPPSTKNVLFGDKGQVRKELDRLVRVSAAEEKSQGAVNVSGTASANVFMDAIAQGGVGKLTGHNLAEKSGWMRATMAGASGAAGMSPRAQARMMTNADFVRWLADGTKKLSADPARIGVITADHLGKLSGLAVAKPELAPDIEGYLTQWKDAMNPAEESATE